MESAEKGATNSIQILKKTDFLWPKMPGQKWALPGQKTIFELFEGSKIVKN